MDFTALSPQERLFHEHVHALYQEFFHTAMTAPNGHVLDQTETAAGNVKINRQRFFCRKHNETAFPADAVLGLHGGYSVGAVRQIVLAGGSWSYQQASEHLKEFTGLFVSSVTIRKYNPGTDGAGAKLFV